MSDERFAPRTPVAWFELHPPGSDRVRTGVVVEHQIATGIVVIATHGEENARYEIPQHRVSRWQGHK